MRADLAFDALADPVRRQMLSLLAEMRESSVGELADRIEAVGRTSVSSHLRVLRGAGLVIERREGRYRFYSVDPSGVATEVIALLQSTFVDALRDTRKSATASESAGSAGSSRSA